MIRGIEERSLNAWPALRHLLHDGWLLRFAGGYTRRANSVNALFPGKGRIEENVAWCEEQYNLQQLPAIFKITPVAQPEALDMLLEEMAYRREAETDVLYATMPSGYCVPDTKDNTVILPREEWLDAYGQITRQSPEQRIWHQAILQAIIPAVCPVALLEQGRPVAVALGVLERGMLGIYDVYTDVRYRRQGCASRLLAAIHSWAVAKGAQGAYLQVMSENLPAQALYARLGFKPCYRYWYRIQHSPTHRAGRTPLESPTRRCRPTG